MLEEQLAMGEAIKGVNRAERAHLARLAAEKQTAAAAAAAAGRQQWALGGDSSWVGSASTAVTAAVKVRVGCKKAQ